MKTKRVLIATLSLAIALMTLFASVALAATVSENYQAIPLKGLTVGKDSVSDSPYAFPAEELQKMIGKDAGNELYQLLGNGEILTAWQPFCQASGSGNLIVLETTDSIPPAVTNDRKAFITRLEMVGDDVKYVSMEAVNGIGVNSANNTITINSPKALSFEKEKAYAIFIVKCGSGPDPEPVKPVIINKDYKDDYPFDSIDVTADGPLPEGLTLEDIKPWELSDPVRKIIGGYLSDDKTLDLIDWPEGFKKDGLVSLSVLTAVGIEVSHDVSAKDGKITFKVKIDGFAGTFANEPYVFLVKEEEIVKEKVPAAAPAGKALPDDDNYRLQAFPAQYDKAEHTVTFTVDKYKTYFVDKAFNQNLAAIGDVKSKSTPQSSGSSGGCSVGLGALALLALIPFVIRRKK